MNRTPSAAHLATPLAQVAMHDPDQPRPSRVGVIDIGSSTATLALYQGGSGGFVDRVDQVGQPLRLMRALAGGKVLTRDAITRTVDAMRTFHRRAQAFGAERLDAFATSAVRDATNRGALVAAIRAATGIELVVISGEDEARAAAASAVNTLPLVDGVVVDIGGGSIQLAQVHARRVRDVVSLPLGSLRLTDALLRGDPPTGAEMVALRRHADAALRAHPWLRDIGRPVVVGIGGTIRALAKLRRRARVWPVQHGHGFLLTLDDVLASVDVLSRMPQSARVDVPGLASHRVDTIVAGAVVVASVMRVIGADSMLVSTYGLREGFAAAALHGEGALRDVREAGLRGRFPCPGGAARRASVRAIRLFDRSRRRHGLSPADRPALAAATWIAATDASDPLRVLREPLQGHTQAEVLTAARLLGVLPGEIPAALQDLFAASLASD